MVPIPPRLTASPPARLGALLLASFAAPALIASCASTPTVDVDATPARMYEGMVADMERRRGAAGIFDEASGRAELRFDEMARRVEAGELETASDHFHAGAILVRSSRMEHLLLAESLGRRAVILGDDRGKPVSAEALDRQALVSGAPQLFGTQYAYNAMTGLWQLYKVDDEVTDADREAMGLPPLSWFEERVRQLNASKRTQELRGELGLPAVSAPGPGR